MQKPRSPYPPALRTRASSSKPGRQVTVFERGNSLLQRHHFSAALDCFDRYIKLGSREGADWGLVYLLKAICLEKLGQQSKAINAYQNGVSEAVLQHERSTHSEQVEATMRRAYARLKKELGMVPVRRSRSTKKRTE